MDINPNGDAFLGVDPDFAVVGEKVFFAAIGATGETELYIYDCSAPVGSELEVVDIDLGSNSIFTVTMAAVGDKVFFSADDGTVGEELFIATCLSEDEAGFTYPADVCIDDMNPIATITGITGGNFSVDNGATIDPVTGELDLSTTTEGTTYTVTYTSNNIGTCGPFEQMVTVTSCAIVPTMGEWGVLCLSLLLMIMGVVVMRQKEFIY